MTAIDVLRGLAIYGVVFDHALRCFDLHDALPRLISIPLTLGLRSCTPLFIFAFGIMLELVYVKDHGQPLDSGKIRRILIRSGQCWAGYLLICLVPVVTFQWPIQQGLLAAGGLGMSRYGEILKFYALALLIAPIHLFLSARYGKRWLFTGFTLSLLSFIIVDFIQWPPPTSPAASLTGLIAGRPVGMSYFSLWHGWVFVAAGTLVGQAARSWRSHGKMTPILRQCILLWVCSCASIIVFFLWHGWDAVIEQLVGTASIRTYHLFIYYAAGVAVASALTFIACGYAALRPDAFSQWPKLITSVGRESLFIFISSSAVFAAVPHLAETLPLPTRVTLSLLLLGFIGALLWIKLAYNRRT